MTKLVEIIRVAAEKGGITRTGRRYDLDLLPPLRGDQLEMFEATLPYRIPDDVKDLLKFCSGFASGSIADVDLSGRWAFQFESAFPYGLPIAGDGFGNFWVVDLWPDSAIWGPIYFACHDPPVVLLQSNCIDEFLKEVLEGSCPPRESLVDDVHQDRIFHVSRKNPGVREYDDVIRSEDSALRAFAQELGPTFQFIDLRNAPVGMGFSWGRYGPWTVVKRYGVLPIFAYEKRPGFLARLFGRLSS